ncbi:MAG TPA: outer membrane lipoprotein carrier protein LolA [Polyangiaceae bacterium LLY-WYZ-15_(1-7)]|nr:hypothetical protein [Myxococcales bacterium]MAT27831.1 hypothetical protein [Sandaracinus sp.]HJL05841.1 outer membrane lipoprotein carrier protein LolA [Polyangiaceae bacterium LLY-WYZ-15_(1-7)]MBJ71267.1 hypothetical protein [Sandaracinus sp.]HJL13879.1 outer membrane lipoprotein carrier protein LolA [Polyangiaceae bacterium LLY-WYZ-15_(1-7)]
MRCSSGFARRLAAALALALFVGGTIGALAAPGLAQERAPSLDELLTAFRGMSGLSARFREEKRVALLAVPLRSEGEIHFAPPGRLLRRVTSPTPSAALIEDGRLTMTANGERQEIDLSSNPVVAGFVSSFRHVLAGDRAALEETYRIGYAREDDGGWELTLRPKGAPLDQFLERMVMRGRGTNVVEMRMVEVSGDTTVTTFHDVNVGRRWSEAELRRVFRL